MKRGPYRRRPEPGTVADLVMRFRGSPRSLAWAAATSRARERVLGAFLRENGRVMVADIRRGHIVAMRDELAATPSAANAWLKAIRILLAYAVEIEMVAANVAADVARLETPNPDGHRTWRDDEIAAYEAAHAPGTLARRVMTLALYTGAARADLVALGPGNVADGRLRYRRRKARGRAAPTIDIPVLPALAAELELAPPGMTFLETAFGRARSAKGLGGDFAAWVAAAGLDGADEHGRTLGLHGLRKAMGRRLAEAGASPAEIMSVLGHLTIAMAAHYSAAYDRAKAADSGLGKIAAGRGATVVRLERKRGES